MTTRVTIGCPTPNHTAKGIRIVTEYKLPDGSWMPSASPGIVLDHGEIAEPPRQALYVHGAARLVVYEIDIPAAETIRQQPFVPADAAEAA